MRSVDLNKATGFTDINSSEEGDPSQGSELVTYCVA